MSSTLPQGTAKLSNASPAEAVCSALGAIAHATGKHRMAVCTPGQAMYGLVASARCKPVWLVCRMIFMPLVNFDPERL
jgi:hypothetical protein